MNLNFRMPFLVDPDEPLRPRERTLSIRVPRWLARLLGWKSADPRILINIRTEPP